MRWYLNPVRLAHGAGKLKSLATGGGPKSVRVKGIGHPHGIFVPRVRVSLEVVGSNGGTTAFEPEFPIGLYLGFGYRLGRLFHLPLIKDADPGAISGEFRIPGR
ncbi:MAG: hypothetical protein U0R51_06385 [Solirubrobacterales bacterium]